DLGSLEHVLRAQRSRAEALDGTNSAEEIDLNTPYTPAEYLWFVLQVVKGLQCLADNGIVYRDIDVRNVLVATRRASRECPGVCV
ncbi:hypothetical protein SARC_13720, partial [Sphaeroforma arctica JP610]